MPNCLAMLIAMVVYVLRHRALRPFADVSLRPAAAQLRRICGFAELRYADDMVGIWREFCEDHPWMHLDIAGTADNDGKAATGAMIRSVVNVLQK